jgi:hypothetical protein
MVIAERHTAFPKVLSGRRRASGSTEQVFAARARVLGVEVSPLLMRKPARVFSWIGRNEEFFHVSWPKRKSLSLFGLLEVSWTRWGSVLGVALVECLPILRVPSIIQGLHQL